MAIPDGTRANLLRLIAVYEHDLLAMDNARLGDIALPGAALAARVVDIAGANGDRALGEARQPVTGVAYASWWPLGAVLVVVALIAAGGGFTLGRTTGLDDTLARG